MISQVNVSGETGSSSQAPQGELGGRMSVAGTSWLAGFLGVLDPAPPRQGR
jgi:hypothetical protein